MSGYLYTTLAFAQSTAKFVSNAGAPGGQAGRRGTIAQCTLTRWAVHAQSLCIKNVRAFTRLIYERQLLA